MAESVFRQHWVIVTSPENYATTREMGFTIQGIKSRHRKKAEQIRPGDKVVYYVTQVQALAAVAEVVSPYFEDKTLLWRCKSNRDTEVYPYRFRIQPDLVLPETAYLPMVAHHLKIQYLKKWPEAHWRLGFQGNIHLWPESDFDTVYPLMLSLLRQQEVLESHA